MNIRNTKKTVIDTIAISIVKKISNFFWDIADTWSYKSDKIAQYYNKSIEEEYKKECEACGIASNSKVLHIGCGSYPLTEIVLAQCCQGAIVGIDKNTQAVRRGYEIMQKHHLEKKITIAQGNGTNYPVNDFDLIFISSCSFPKVQILEHLFKNTKHHSKIIVREISIAVTDILQCINAHPDIEIIKQIYHTPFPFYGPFGWTTFHLRKN
jgi:precorrin-6B methylase 2